MDRLIDAVAEYLCRHRSVGLLRLTLDLTRRRLDLSAEIGAVEVARNAVAPPTPDTETWRRAAVREAVYTLRGLVQYVQKAEVVNWTGLLTTRRRAARHYRPAQLRGRYFPPSYFCEEERRLYPTECKTKLHTHRQEDKNHIKTHNNRYVSRRSKRDETSKEPRRASRTTTTRSRISKRNKTRKNKEKISLEEYEKKK
jgi:hypothetical protein